MNFSHNPSMMEPNESNRPKVEDPHISGVGSFEIKAKHSDVDTEEDLDEKYIVIEKGIVDGIENQEDRNTAEEKKEVVKDKVSSLLENLSPSNKIKIEGYIKKGRPDEVTRHIAGLGLSMSSQEDLIKHFTKYLEDGIKRISWNGKRLAYAVAILEQTLDSAENKNIASIKNMIRNYLIFCKVFKENEDNKLPRYGQFSYVMRTIFAGVTSKEDIDEKIKKHKTFGEKADLTKEELDAMRSAAEEVDRDMSGANGKKHEADESINESTEEAKREKSIVWGGGMGKLKEYKFNNYTFQTNSIQDPDRVGKDTATGRSSWEPLFVAYVDHINKKIENRISKKDNISEEEKERRIRETRVELLYEKFNFPVALKVDKNGKYKATVYVLDFIDVNRWKGIEIKGPLTPEAGEKIRQFQKYYVDGDFSDLEGEEQVVMMEYVQEALDGLKNWCVENNYPVFNQFSSLEVLGAYKWDYDLNNFNSYEEARHMKELSVKTRLQLQKGFIKLVEDRIKSGKTPDIRPEHYVLSDDLPKVEKFGKQEGKKEGLPFNLEKPAATKPYIPEKIITNLTKQKNNHIDEIIFFSVIDTLPLSSKDREILDKIKQNFSVVSLIIMINNLFEKSPEFANICNNGEEKYLPLSKVLSLVSSNMSPVFLKKSIGAIQSYLVNLDKNSLTKTNIPELISEVSLLEEKFNIIFYNDMVLLNRSSFLTMHDISNDFGIKALLTKIQFLVLGKFESVFLKRYEELHFLYDAYLFQSELDPETVKKYIYGPLYNNGIGGYEGVLLNASTVVLAKEGVEFDVVRNLRELLVLHIDGSIMIDDLGVINLALDKEFSSIKIAAEHFSSKDSGLYKEEEYLDVLRSIKSKTVTLDFLESRKNIFMMIIKILIVDEIGQERYARVVNEVTQHRDEFFKKIKEKHKK